MKINELIPILVTIKDLALQLVKAIDLITETAEIVAPKAEAAKIETKSEIAVQTPKKEVTLVEVRTVLAGLSKNGYTNDVKALLKKYGAEKLSGIKPEDYAAILSDAEALANGGGN